MTLKDCYTVFGGDYQGVMERLGSERIVQKFAFKFLKDPSYGMLTEAMEAGDEETAFRAAHTIKGICQNLGFGALGDSASRLTEALRHRKSEEYEALYGPVKEDYEKTVSALLTLQAQVGA